MDAYRLAIDQAKDELTDARERLKALTLRVSQLESVVTQLEALTAAASPARGPMLFDAQVNNPKTGPFSGYFPVGTTIVTGRIIDTDWPLKAPANTPVEPPPPLWKAIVNALNGKKSDFTVPEAIAALERTGRHVASPNRLNIVRNTLIHSKAFGRFRALVITMLLGTGLRP